MTSLNCYLSLQATAKLLHTILCAKIKPTFHKINVHAAMTPSDIQEHFRPVFDQARELSGAYNKSKERASKRNSVEDVDFIDLGSPLGRRRLSASKRGVFQSVMTSLAPGLKHSINEDSIDKKFAHRIPFVTVSSPLAHKMQLVTVRTCSQRAVHALIVH